MKKVLVTGGTVFVSRYVAKYYVHKGYEVYVLNRNHLPQSAGVKLIQADRNQLGDILRDEHFDAILDITAYTKQDISLLLDAVGSFDDYIMVSSSAVYQDAVQSTSGNQHSWRFTEDSPLGPCSYWGSYGINKMEAEQELLKRVPHAYILRPPYLYGPMNNVYREAFVFECALRDRLFYLPGDGEMKLQFFHVRDLCRVMDAIFNGQAKEHILNIGNEDTVTIKEWVELCYAVTGRQAKLVPVHEKCEQRNYFSFYDYEYYLDVTRQKELIADTMPIEQGLMESYTWYVRHPDRVNRKPYIDYIEEHLTEKKNGAVT